VTSADQIKRLLSDLVDERAMEINKGIRSMTIVIHCSDHGAEPRIFDTLERERRKVPRLKTGTGG
jgi:phosphopentomutase